MVNLGYHLRELFLILLCCRLSFSNMTLSHVTYVLYFKHFGKYFRFSFARFCFTSCCLSELAVCRNLAITFAIESFEINRSFI